MERNSLTNRAGGKGQAFAVLLLNESIANDSTPAILGREDSVVRQDELESRDAYRSVQGAGELEPKHRATIGGPLRL